MSAPQRPSLLQKARAFAVARVEKTDLWGDVQVPHGRHFVTKENEMMLRVPHPQSARFRRVYGFAASAGLGNSKGATPPLLFNVVLRLPFYFASDALQAAVVDERGLDFHQNVIILPFRFPFVSTPYISVIPDGCTFVLWPIVL